MTSRFITMGRALLIAFCAAFAVNVGYLACGGEVVQEDEVKLCSGANCSNGSNCPAEEPSDGAACTSEQYGNCHYCAGDSNEAEGYTCDGSSWSAAGTFTCDV